MKRFFVSNIVPPEMVVELRASQAANNFCFNLIENKCFDECYSISPPSYNLNISQLNGKIKYYTLFRTKKYKKVIQYINQSIKIAKELEKADCIWFYNIVNSTVLTYFITKFIFRKKVFVILADHTPGGFLFSFQNLLEYFIRSSNGVIALSSRSLIKNSNMGYLPGIIPSYKISNKYKTLNKPLKFLFSGSLSAVTGITMALEVFSEIPDAELYVTGNGDIPTMYKDLPNIHFLGMIEYDEYKQILKDSDVCLNLRNTDLVENLNNFPSKILEYFSMNKIVLSTIDYPELINAKYIKSKYQKLALMETVKGIIDTNLIDLLLYTDNSDFLLNWCSEVAWKNEIKRIENGY